MSQQPTHLRCIAPPLYFASEEPVEDLTVGNIYKVHHVYPESSENEGWKIHNDIGKLITVRSSHTEEDGTFWYLKYFEFVDSPEDAWDRAMSIL